MKAPRPFTSRPHSTGFGGDFHIINDANGKYVATVIASEVDAYVAWANSSAPAEKPEDGPHAPRSRTPRTDAVIEEMLHGDGIPRCDEWDRITAHARTLEVELRVVEANLDAEITGPFSAKSWDQLTVCIREHQAALKGVIAVADRATDEFDAARACLAKWSLP